MKMAFIMLDRFIELTEKQSFFLFGARGTGKTTLLRSLPWFDRVLYINLLEAKTENRFARNPDALSEIVKALPENKTHVAIDEVQKLPKLLDIVHDLIESGDVNVHFILTGSSARRLKRGGANLLAGRAFVYHLFPLSYLELDELFDLQSALQYGTLPKLCSFDQEQEKQMFLEAYTNTYLKEEVWAEKYVRDLDHFRYFLEVAAQANGKIINFSNFARDVGVTDSTIKDYFSILEDTLIGFYLQPFQHSFRKRLSKKPKFYYFDPGVARTLNGLIEVPLLKQTNGYGNAFEHFIITQCKLLASYKHRNYRFSYLATKDGAEIDLVVERPGKNVLFIEIKSTIDVEARHLSTLKSFKNDFGDCEAVCFSQDPYPKMLDGISVYPWQEGIREFFC